MSPALRARLPILVLVKVLVNATLAEGVKALIDSMCVAKKSLAQRALEPLMQVLLLDSPDQSGLAREA